jgi:hypothetical protein
MRKYLIPILASAVTAVAANAQWNVISTFDDASALDLVTDSTNIEGSNARTEIIDGKLAAFPGDVFENTSNLYALLDLGTDLKAASQTSGGPVTVYVEVTQPTVSDGQGGTRKAIVDTVWGVANIDSDVVLETRYNSYNVMQRINVGTDNFEGRNGGGYWTTGEMFQADVTYKIWLVVDYNLNFYEAYVQGGQWTEQTKLDTEDGTGIWLFRVNPAPEDTVDKFMIALSRGNTVDGEKGIDPTYFDNIAIDVSGQNLTEPVASAWNVVSTFDDASALDIVTDSTNIEGSNARTEIIDGKLAAFPGDVFENTSNLYALVDMGADLKAMSQASGGPVTVYVEVTQPTVSDGQGGTRKAIVDTVWGMANIDSDVVLETRYNSYNVMQRINVGTDNFEGRNGGGYWTTGEMFQADVTYKIWLVVDYNLNFYEAYVQGGQWTEQTKLDTEDGTGIWLFRVNPAPEDTVDKFMIALSRGNTVDGEKGIDPTYFDNLAYADGMDLSTPSVGGGPVGDTWAGFDVTADGDAFTGDWLGWVNVTFDPWIFSYSLNQWMFIDESAVTASGGWVYVFNF